MRLSDEHKIVRNDMYEAVIEDMKFLNRHNIK